MATRALSMGCGWPGLRPSYIRSPILKSGFLATILKSASGVDNSEWFVGPEAHDNGPETTLPGQNLETVKHVAKCSDI